MSVKSQSLFIYLFFYLLRNYQHILTLRVVLESERERREESRSSLQVAAGVPQGSVLRPLVERNIFIIFYLFLIILIKFSSTMTLRH